MLGCALMFGHIRFFEHFSRQYISEFFGFADYIELNDNAQDLLFEKLGIKTEAQLFELFDLEFLVITKGKRGARFVFRDERWSGFCFGLRARDCC